MKYILIGGAPNVGKTGAIYRLAIHLKNNGFKDDSRPVPEKRGDFYTILEGKDRNGENIRIAVNSQTDDEDIIKKFKTFLDEQENISIVISSIRDGDFPPDYSLRSYFFKIFNIAEGDIEVPLAKIIRKRKNKEKAVKWYECKIDKLLIKLLESYL